MAEESTQLAARNRLMRREAASLTPEQRMDRMWALQRACFEALASNPEAFDRFWRRNLRKRAVHHDPRFTA